MSYCNVTQCPFWADTNTIQSVGYETSLENQNYSNQMYSINQDKKPQVLKKLVLAVKDVQNRIMIDQNVRIDYNDESAVNYPTSNMPVLALPGMGSYCIYGTFYTSNGPQTVLCLNAKGLGARKILGVCLACSRFEKIDIVAEIAANNAIEVLK